MLTLLIIGIIGGRYGLFPHRTFNDPMDAVNWIILQYNATVRYFKIHPRSKLKYKQYGSTNL